MQKPGNERGQRNSSFIRKAAQAIALGTNLVVGMGLFTFAGYYLDHKHGGGILWTMCGMVMGLIYGAYEVWKVIRILNSADGDRSNDSTGNSSREK